MAESQLAELQNIRVLLEEARQQVQHPVCEGGALSRRHDNLPIRVPVSMRLATRLDVYARLRIANVLDRTPPPPGYLASGLLRKV
jgi:hypothetical protein